MIHSFTTISSYLNIHANSDQVDMCKFETLSQESLLHGNKQMILVFSVTLDP